MAKKEQELTASMIDTFREFKETKNIDRTTLVSVLEESFRHRGSNRASRRRKRAGCRDHARARGNHPYHVKRRRHVLMQ